MGQSGGVDELYITPLSNRGTEKRIRLTLSTTVVRVLYQKKLRVSRVGSDTFNIDWPYPIETLSNLVEIIDHSPFVFAYYGITVFSSKK